MRGRSVRWFWVRVDPGRHCQPQVRVPSGFSCGAPSADDRQPTLDLEHTFEVMYMLTVREVADRYQCSTKLVVGLLARIGFSNAAPETHLSAAIVYRFDQEWGDRIRAKRPEVESGFTGEMDTASASARTDRKPKPHVMRVAHARITGGRDVMRNRVSKLLVDPGPVHAIDAAGTRDGDPWAGEIVPGAVHFFGGPMNSGPTAACGWMHMRAVLGDEFVPADDPERENQCPRCAAIVADGKGFRNPPQPYFRSIFCERYLRMRIDGVVTVKDCSLRDRHDGPHRARDGAEWGIGADDYAPAPDEVGRNITTAS